MNLKTQTKAPQVTFIKTNEPKNINKSTSSNFHQNNKPKNINKSALSNFHKICLKSFRLLYT